MIAVLRDSDWHPREDARAFEARVALPPGAERCLIRAAGWDAAAAAAVTARWGESAAERPFLPLLPGAEATGLLDRPAGTTDAAPLRLVAPAPPPGGCRVLALRRRPRDPAGLGPLLPRGLAPAPDGEETTAPDPATPAPPDPAALVAESLAAGRLAEAMATCAAAALDGEAARTQAAARLLLDHLARHPMARDPALGALLGALLVQD